MDDLPYTSPDEDPFHALPPQRTCPPPTPWIQEQHSELEPAPAELEDISELAPTTPPRAGTPQHAFLAYPDLSKLALDEGDSLYSYDIVDDDDLPDATLVMGTPQDETRATGKQAKGRVTSSTFRNLNLSFRASRYPIGLTSTPDDTPTTPSPRTSSRLTCTLPTPDTASPSTHTRSASLSTLHMPVSPTPKSPTPSSKWRPTILGHFSHSSQASIIPPLDTTYTPPRPSLSSGDTCISGTPSASQTATSADSDMPLTPSRPSFLESIRSKNRSSLSIFKSHSPSTPSSSICSPSRPNFHDINEEGPSSTSCFSTGGDSTLPRRVPFAPKPGGQYDNLLDDEEDLDVYVPPPPKRESARSSISFSSTASFSRVSFGSLGSKHQKKRKRLVISGVGVHETRKFEGVKRWCETFGEIRQITRVANGDLHIDFRRPDVADTVCRIRAKVFIAGVGSVYLSWTTGDKR
ncbi:hypothetical protein DFP72DRAFT_985609 [Ephemerocybe angulata]|uniref:RRM domain-containing protein n=1 Tax=Ephemerocybe angulata TaxID=980116 RepID=A0A8H6IJ25_9AGAR|nr:hypothetical protein DFP72DRAFT_985609 [Tulosesus angulatus]